jgi:hypothetical protein
MNRGILSSGLFAMQGWWLPAAFLCAAVAAAAAEYVSLFLRAH